MEMPDPGPFIGRNAVIQYVSGGTAYTIGYAQNVTTSLTQDIIKEYTLGSQSPVILAAGLQTYKVSCSRLFIDTTFLAIVSAGTAMNFILAPGGTTAGTGNAKITLVNVVLGTWNMKWDQKGVVIEDFNGEGQGIATGTF
jgi:hypothetical protein